MEFDFVLPYQVSLLTTLCSASPSLVRAGNLVIALLVYLFCITNRDSKQN